MKTLKIILLLPLILCLDVSNKQTKLSLRCLTFKQAVFEEIYWYSVSPPLEFLLGYHHPTY